MMGSPPYNIIRWALSPERRWAMVPIGKDYYYHEDKIYKEIKPSGLKAQRYKLINKDGKRVWITLDQIKKIVANKQI